MMISTHAFHEDHNMLYVKVHKPLLVALATCAATCFLGGNVYADDAQSAAALKEQLRIMQQRIEELSKQVDNLTKKAETQPPAATVAPAPAKVAKEAKEAPPAE